MPAYPIQIDFHLGTKALVDVLILQWYTPELHNGGKIPAPEAASKDRLLEQLKNWLVQNFETRVAVRPLFILAPELSIPLCCDGLLHNIVAGMHRPTVLIAGLEFLLWEEYRGMIQQLPQMEHGPVSWLAGGRDDHIVNAAVVWVRDEVGRVTEYIQPKRQPSNQEVPLIYLGQNVLLFLSKNQEPGRRINFCSQICSDFCAPNAVRNLRRDLATASNGAPLDMLFLLQRQMEPAAEEFKHGTAAFFESPLGMIETARGCVVFVNNANQNFGKSLQWGQSQFRFKFDARWSTKLVSNTFYLLDDDTHDHQAAIMREPGRSIYHLAYTPRYLVDRLAGPAGQQVPFPDQQAYWSRIDGDTFSETFKPVPAVCHWLECEWAEGELELLGENVRSNLPRDVGAAFLQSYRNGLQTWKGRVRDNELLARKATDLYFCCWGEQDAYPSLHPEPKGWCATASHGAKRLMQAYALSALAVQRHIQHQIVWSPEETIHAVANGRMAIAFLWGAGSRSSKAMITEYRALENTYGITNALTPTSLIVLVDPQGPVPANFTEDLITRAPSPTHAHHLRPQGNLVDATLTHRQIYMSDNDLYGPLHNAANTEELTNGLADRIKEFGV